MTGFGNSTRRHVVLLYPSYDFFALEKGKGEEGKNHLLAQPLSPHFWSDGP